MAGSVLRRFLSIPYEGLLLFSVFILAGAVFPGAIDAAPMSLTGRLAFQFYLMAVGCIYFVSSWKIGGQTLAMKAWKVRLEGTRGAPLAITSLLLRFVFLLLTTGIAGLGFVWALVDPDRQFLHDRLAGTRIRADV